MLTGVLEGQVDSNKSLCRNLEFVVALNLVASLDCFWASRQLGVCIASMMFLFEFDDLGKSCG